MMTSRDFIKIAVALRAQKPAPHWDANKGVQWRLDVTAIADVSATLNPALNRGLFLDACGWKDEA